MNLNTAFCGFFILASSLVFGQKNADKIDGITMVAPPSEIEYSAMEDILSVNAEWICFVPYGYMRSSDDKIRYNLDRQWWGEREEGIRASISLARKAGLKIMLKPQIYLHGTWIGDVGFENEVQWNNFEASYSEFINFWKTIAIEYEVELFIIGTECKRFARERPEYWKNLIIGFRDDFCGEISYSANWDEYQDIGFWEELDYIGVSAYFPLLEEKEPTEKQFTKAWKPYFKELGSMSKSVSKKVLFTEYGYLTVDGCAGKTWLLEKQVHELDKNEAAQANALQALYEQFIPEEFWAGGFLWKWFPHGMGHEGYKAKDYCPQGKQAEEIIKKYYNRI